MDAPNNQETLELAELLESCAEDREQEAHDAERHTPEAVEPFMDDARRLRAHAAYLRAHASLYFVPSADQAFGDGETARVYDNAPRIAFAEPSHVV